MGKTRDLRFHRTNLFLIAVVLCGLLPSLPSYGAIIREWWLGIGGTSVADLMSDPRHPNDPDGSELLDLFEGPTNWGNDYGSRLYGWLVAPESGEYTFWIASDDNSELWLSTDEEPANVQLIAYVNGWTNAQEWTKFASQRSRVIILQANRKYYIEAIMKERGGGDNIAVAWQPPQGSQVVISGRSVDASMRFCALSAIPADGTICTSTWVNLSWLPGERAVSHHVYFSTNLDAITRRERSTLVAVTDEPSALVGLPGSGFPNGLQTGITYYWCVDEVDDDDPDSPWRGQVWSFRVSAELAVYLLITNQQLADAFEPLVQRRTDQGFPGRLLTVETICASYVGEDEPEKIRNCIIDHYTRFGTQYVALGGDQKAVSVRYCDPRSSNVFMPVDLYLPM